MPQPSSRRVRSRRANSSPDDIEMPDSSPSRPRSKRRKVAEAVELEVPLTQDDLIHVVTSSLALPEETPVVAKQWANEANYQQNSEGIKAYAKMAGTNWTYYIQALKIRIGRPPDSARPTTAAGSPTPPPIPKPEDAVHIDLGPSKLVSRNHATITYDADGEHNWKLEVIGRNGVKVDNENYQKDSKVDLRSGSVIEIGGVQMMFVLPGEPAVIAKSILHRARLDHIQIEPDGHFHSMLSNDSTVFDSNGPGSSQNARPASANHFTSSISEPVSRAEPPPKLPNANAPAYHRGLQLESTEDMDYSQDSMKDAKPPYSYALLIAQAILSSEGEQLTLNSIYQFIQDKYSFYKHAATGWQNSIRHNLSLNKAFRKIPRRTDEPGKGMKWEVLPEHRDEYIKKLRKPPKHTGRAGSSQSNSPASPRAGKSQGHGQSTPALSQPQNGGARLEDSKDLVIQLSPIKESRSVTPPPMPAYRVAPLEAYTPDRGSRLPALRTDKTLSDTPAAPSPIRPSGRPGDILRNAPLLGDGGGIPPSPINRTYDTSISTVTPAPQRQHPRLAPPSTGQLPSSYLPTSSPAPFWKYVQFESTPAKQPDFSPLKDLHSSSPPPLGEPSNRIRELGSPLKERGDPFGLGRRTEPKALDDDDEDGLGDLSGVDLARGFEKIGKYHSNNRVREAAHWD